MPHLTILLAATLIDRLVGDPDLLWRRIPHPVVGIGALIGVLDRRLNGAHLSPAARRRNGFLAASVLAGGGLLAGSVLSAIFALFGPVGFAIEVLIVAVFLAQKSLLDHVAAVVSGLEDGGLAGGRRAVAMIVGRDVTTLDEAGVSRAAIESLAENASDGIVAPWFWYLVLGLPGLLAYKAINTADSMIGHLNERYRDFGRASARLDDAVNWPAARATALLLVAAAALTRKGDAARIWAITRRDAPSHRSPNAGWPETAMAAALGLSLGGPRRYGDLVVDAACLNGEGRRRAERGDIAAALGLTRILFTLLLALNALLIALTLAAW